MLLQLFAYDRIVMQISLVNFPFHSLRFGDSIISQVRKRSLKEIFMFWKKLLRYETLCVHLIKTFWLEKMKNIWGIGKIFQEWSSWEMQHYNVCMLATDNFIATKRMLYRYMQLLVLMPLNCCQSSFSST